MYITEKSVSQSTVLKFEIFNYYELIFYHRKKLPNNIGDVEFYRLERKPTVCVLTHKLN